MKRIRMGMMAAVVAVMTLGVAAANAACPISYTAFYDNGYDDCRLIWDSYGLCFYDCKFHRYYFT